MVTVGGSRALLRPRRASCWAAALAAAALVGCAQESGPPGSGAAPAGASPTAGDRAGTAAAPELAAGAARAAPFDYGPVKTPAEYLADPGLASADAARGQLLSLACAACHTFDAGGKTIVGPNLNGIFGRPAAALPEFPYSAALRASGLVWTPRSLEAWLADPAGFVAGTNMAFTGYRSLDDRRDLIAYLLRATD